MRLSVERVPRRLPGPWWGWVVVAGWLGLIATTVWLSHRTGVEVPLCMLKRVTGVPCPTCGGTRMGLSMLRGDVVRAWQFNPMLATVLSVGGLVVLVQLVFGRAIRLNLTRRQRKVFWAAIIAAAGANWAYVILVGDRIGK
ncbi:MAG: DUF2752 domain-containing protein [Phycisphaerae bacterium]